MTNTIAFIGGGNMSSAILHGLIENASPAASIVVSEPNMDNRKMLSESFHGIRLTDSNQDAAASAEIVILAVKPQVLGAVCAEIRATVQTHQPLLLSIAAGVNTKTIDDWVGGGASIARVMPNQPALLGQGMSGVYANARCTEEQRATAVELMRAVGRVVVVDQEDDIDTVTAISGSGPAYFYLLVQMLSDKAQERGLSADVARELAVQTAVGSAAIMQASDTDLKTLIERVRSPGGTTQAALEHLEEHRIRDIFASALDAARTRAADLARAAQTNAKKG